VGTDSRMATILSPGSVSFSRCTAGEPEDKRIVVGSKIDTEGALRGHTILLLLEDAGYPVQDKSYFGPTETIRTALLTGELDVKPQHTGTGMLLFPDTDPDIWEDAALSSVMFATRGLNEAVKLADRPAVMPAGRLVQYDAPETVQTRPVNASVRNFVGADKALKGLSRIPVAAVMRPTVSAPAGQVERLVSTGSRQRHVWLVGADERLEGCIDTRCSEESGREQTTMSLSEIEQMAVRETASLREALRRCWDRGLRTIPVVDDMGYLKGQVSLRDVEEATVE